MTGKIDTEGTLWRDGKKLYCPLNASPNCACYCGDWCPAFREPFREVDVTMSHGIVDGELAWTDLGTGVVNREGPYSGRTRLRLCSMVGELVFDEFVDER